MTDTMTFAEVDVPQDSTPETDAPVLDPAYDYHCEVCGAGLVYGGRGRKPVRCDVHKKSRSTATGTGNVKRVTGNAANLAGQATEALAQINGFMALGAMVAGMHNTAGAIAGYDATFRESVYNALLTDPELAKYIMRAGTKGGKLALGMAYVMMGVTVVPTALAEYREMQAIRQAKKEADEAEQQARLF